LKSTNMCKTQHLFVIERGKVELINHQFACKAEVVHGILITNI